MHKLDDFIFKSLGQNCVLIQTGLAMSLKTSQRVLALSQRIQDAKLPGCLDLVPAYTELAVYFDSNKVSCFAFLDAIKEIFIALKDEANETKGPLDPNETLKQLSNDSNAPEKLKSRLFQFPVSYTGEDLERLAGTHGLSIQEVIQIHSKVSYLVAMKGFLPHFPYLLGLDKRLETPRQNSPRIKVKKGAVAIGGAQTGIYPIESPGGWNIIGYTQTDQLSLIKPGDIIQFIPERI